MSTIRNRPIRVAHVALQLDMGGMEKLLVEFARHANRRCFDLRFISLSQRGCLADEIEECGWPVTCLEEPAGFRPGLVNRLATLFRQWKLDVVHIHNTKPLIVAAPAARLARVPRVVHTRHGQRLGARWRETALFRLASLLTDRMVCVSQDGVRLSAREGIAIHKLATIWNGIDLARFGYVGPQADGPAVMVGRLSPEKDVATLVRAAAIIVREHPLFRLEIAGDGECFAALKRLTDELGLLENVLFLGEVRDITRVLARASLFVLPSITEGIPLTVLEAMARGLPVIATRAGGNPEVVVDGETGYLVPIQNPTLMAEKVLIILKKPALAKEMGWKARERVVRHFQVQDMVHKYEALYGGITANGHVSLPNGFGKKLNDLE